MSEMVERVARRIAENAVKQNPMLQIWDRNEHQVIGYFDEYDNKFYDCEKMARAAIEAMRIPTDIMIASGDAEVSSRADRWVAMGKLTSPAHGAWCKMIDAALKESP